MILTKNVQFFICATTAFSERYDLLFNITLILSFCYNSGHEIIFFFHSDVPVIKITSHQESVWLFKDSVLIWPLGVQL